MYVQLSSREQQKKFIEILEGEVITIEWVSKCREKPKAFSTLLTGVESLECAAEGDDIFC